MTVLCILMLIHSLVNFIHALSLKDDQITLTPLQRKPKRSHKEKTSLCKTQKIQRNDGNSRLLY